MFPNSFNRFMSLGLNRIRNQKYVSYIIGSVYFHFIFKKQFSFYYFRILSHLCVGSDQWEMRIWPWRVVFFSNLLGSAFAFMFAISEFMSDLSYLHQANSAVQFLWWISFTACLFQNPSFVTESTSPGKGAMHENSILKYADVLEKISTASLDGVEHPTLCHSCHVVRPLRSKHCRALRRCVKRVIILTYLHLSNKFMISLIIYLPIIY